MEERGWACRPVALQTEVIHIDRVDMGPGFEAKTVEEVFSVVFLPVEGPGQATMLPFVAVEKLDGSLPTRESRILVLERRESGQS